MTEGPWPPATTLPIPASFTEELIAPNAVKFGHAGVVFRLRRAEDMRAWV